MRSRTKNILAWSLLPMIILVKWLGAYPRFIETHYSLGLYAKIAAVLRTLYGWVPFSVGDLAYIGLFITALFLLIAKRKNLMSSPKSALRDLVALLAVAYAAFHLLWGMNYYRVPLNEHLGIKTAYSDKELLAFTNELIQQANSQQVAITGDAALAVAIPYNREELFNKVEDSYEGLSRNFPGFSYERSALKPSLISLILQDSPIW